jgi:hypothetical protein
MIVVLKKFIVRIMACNLPACKIGSLGLDSVLDFLLVN